MLVVPHEMQFARDIANRAIFMDIGRQEHFFRDVLGAAQP